MSEQNNQQQFISPWYKANSVTKIGMIIGSLGFTCLKVYSYISGQDGELSDVLFITWIGLTFLFIFTGSLKDALMEKQQKTIFKQLINASGLFILYVFAGIFVGLILVDLLVFLIFSRLG